MKSELNFPIGEKEPLDFGQASDGRRWAVAMHLIDGFNAAVSQVLNPNPNPNPNANPKPKPKPKPNPNLNPS